MIFHMSGGGLEAGEGPFEVDMDDGIPFVFGHIEQGSIAEDPGVIDQDIEASEVVDGGIDEGLSDGEGADGIGVGDGLTAGLSDFFDDGVGGLAGPGTFFGAAGIIDDDFGTLGGEHQGVFTAETGSSAGDDGDFIFQPEHRSNLRVGMSLSLVGTRLASDRFDEPVLA